MPRKARVVVPGSPHHIIQRGNRRQNVFFNDDDRMFYLELMEHYTKKFETYVLAYCLMENHVHHILVPTKTSGLRSVIQAVHMHYAQMINQRMNWQGHLWQERFYSCVVDPKYFWVVMRYVELNPVVAKIVNHAAEYYWSSSQAHCGLRDDPLLFYPSIWKKEIASVGNWNTWISIDPQKDEISD